MRQIISGSSFERHQLSAIEHVPDTKRAHPSNDALSRIAKSIFVYGLTPGTTASSPARSASTTHHLFYSFRL